ncbi:alpha/beta hydrolase [bacterium]|nr:MAG: alpha/beta hydrolase [bacterium]
MPLLNNISLAFRRASPIARLSLTLSLALPLLSSCGSSLPTTPGLELQKEDYATARSHFQTQLIRQGPAPQQGEALQAPASAQQVVYSPTLSLKAWLSSAPTGAASTKHPAVLFLHGGFAIGDGDWDMGRPYQEAGFVVMMPVLRGENSQAGSYSMFYDEVDDVVAAIEYLSQVPYVDANHIYLAGHSVGGTMVQLSALTSPRIKAAAAFSGATDPISWSKGQPEVVPFNTSQTKEFQMRSSLAYATSFKCPTRLYYGNEEDWCATPSQATAERAKAKGLDVEAVSVTGDHFTAVPEEVKQSIAFFQSQQ